MSEIKQASALKGSAGKVVFLSMEEEDDHDHVPEVVDGTNKSDVISTGGGPQHIIAGNGDDYVSAGGGPDSMTGGNGDDVLIGGPGPDTLSGNNGDDVLAGGESPDMLTGGRGSDTFVYLERSDAPARGDEDEHEGGEGEEGGHEGGGDHEDDGCHEDGGPKVETITDFKAGVDKIDFTAFDNLVAFSSGVPTANAIWVEQKGDDTVVMVDLMNGVDGDHPAEMSILLVGVNVDDLSAVDFLF